MAHVCLSFPAPLPEPSGDAGPPHLWPAHAPCPRAGVPQWSPARGWRWGDPAHDWLPALPCPATHGEHSHCQPSPLSRLSPSLSPGSQLASVVSFCSLAIPSLSPSWKFASSTPPRPGILCRRPSHGWLPTLQGSAALSPPQGGPPLPSAPPPLAVPASSLIFSVECITEWPVVFLWCVRCGFWWSLEDRPRLSKPGALTGVWCGPAQRVSEQDRNLPARVMSML